LNILAVYILSLIVSRRGSLCVFSRIATPLLLLVFATGTIARAGGIAVLVPKVREPYKVVLDEIVAGIRDESSDPISLYTLTEDELISNAQDWLHETQPDIVISLGSSGRALTEHISGEYTVINGATFLTGGHFNSGLSGISLAPSPKILLEKLHELAPSVSRVTVIYHAATNGWLINIANRAAAEIGISLNALPAENIRAAAALYRDVLENQNRDTDAIWLLQGDPTLDERSLLPTILNKAWSKSFVVFSSNPSHVKRGALFSLFPDNRKMGGSLLEKALQIVEKGERSLDAVDDLKVAVNIRTAKHLNLKISRSQARSFDLIFPNR